MTEILSIISEQIAGQTIFDWGSVIGALIYLILISRENPLGWFFGIIGCAFWAYAAFYQYQLYIDSGLQVFYILISFWGIYKWLYGGADKSELPISQLKWSEHAFIIGIGTVLSIVTGWLFSNYTEAAAPYWDAFTTVFSVITTIMVIFKKIDNWIYWFLIDSVYVVLYWSRGGYLFALLFIIYLIIVVRGYFNWKRMYQKQSTI